MASRQPTIDPFGARATLQVGDDRYGYFRLDAVGDRLDVARAPVTLKILLENLLRHAGGGIVRGEDVETLAAWRPGATAEAEIPFMPSRVILQDFTGVPGDRRSRGHARRDGRPRRRPVARQPARAGRPRHRPLRPGRHVRQRPGVRLQRRARVRAERRALPAAALGADRVPGPARRAARDRHRPPGEPRVPRDGHRRREGVAFPDTLVGTDSHTTMVNGLGVLGYGVGGIEAEAVLLGQPLYQPMPRIVGVRLHGELPRGSTATDLVLVVTEMLRAHGVVGAFVEFAGDGLAGVTLADRATISNMSPEFGATATLFPIDDETLAYLRLTGRSRYPRGARRALRQNAGAVAGARRRPGVRRAPRARPRVRRALGRRPAASAGPRPAGRAARELPVELPGRPR